MEKNEELNHTQTKFKNTIANLRTNKTFLVCCLLTIIYLISGYWKWLEIGVSLCALTFMAILPLQSSFCIFMFLHNFTLSNIGFDSCFMVTLIGYTIILLVKYWIGVKKGKYVFYRRLVTGISSFYALTTAVGMFLPLYRGAWLYLTYLPFAFLIFAMREEFNIHQGINYMFGGILTACILSLTALIFPHYQYNAILVDDTGSRFTAFFNNPNYLYMRALFILSYYMYLYLRNDLSHLKFGICYALCAGIALATLSKTGIGMLALVTLIFICFFLKDNFKKKIKIVAIFVAVILVICLACFKFIAEIYERFALSFGSDNFLSSLLTGRDEIWLCYLNKSFDNPFRFMFGYGLLTEEVYIPSQEITRASHNLYIFLLYRFGLIGTILLGCLIFKFVKIANKEKPKLIAYLPIIYILIESLFDNTFKCYNFTYFIFAFMILFMHCNDKNKVENTKK